MHILPEKGESTSHNSPIACVELRFLNSILDTFELDPLTVLNITPFEGITDIWSKWGAVLMSPLAPDASCSICKETEHIEYCSGCKIRAYCCNQHKAQDYWNHVPECKDASDFEIQRSQSYNQLISIFTTEPNPDKQQIRQHIHQLHKCLEDILQHDKKRSPALQRASANIEFNTKSEQVQQKLEAFCNICFSQSLPDETSHNLPLNELTSFASSWAQLYTHLRALGLDITKGVKNVLDSFVKQRYMFMLRMCPSQRIYDLLPKSRWFAHLGKHWNFDASRVYLHGRRYIAHRFPRPSELREYWRLMRNERVEIIVQVNDSVEGGSYWKGKDVRIIEESHIVPKPRSIEYITVRKLEIAMEDGIAFEVHQISYRGWKDALVPLDLDVFKTFLDIVDQYRNKMTSPSVPISVHCMAGWGRTGVFIMIDAQRNVKMKPHLILRNWRKMLLQRELIQNPLQLAFCCGFLHTKESFSEEHCEELHDMVVEWFKLVGGVLTHKEHPTYEMIVNTLKNDESGISLKPQNWWVRMRELNADMQERELFLYLVRVSKKALTWICNKQVSLNKLLDIRGESGIGVGARNGIQLLYDEELNFLEKSLL